MQLVRSSILIFAAGLSACGGLQTSPAPVEDRHQQGQDDRRVVPPAADNGSVPGSEPVGTSEMNETPGEAVQQHADRPAQSPSEPVVLAALDEAESHAAEGDTQKAIASLERGIRIKPRDPWLWHQLGVLKLRSGNWLDAISIAQKSNSLAGINRQLLMGNWQVIADANEAMGNLAEANRARRKAESYITE